MGHIFLNLNLVLYKQKCLQELKCAETATDVVCWNKCLLFWCLEGKKKWVFIGKQ